MTDNSLTFAYIELAAIFMRTFILLTYLLTCTILLQAQEHGKAIHLSIDSDTSSWYEIKNSYTKTYDLKSIQNDSNKIAFSIWCYGNLVYISKTKDSVYGEVTKYVKELNGKQNLNRTFKKSFLLSRDKVNQVFSLIDSININRIPSDKFIKNWKQGFDGIEYIIEFKKGDYYSFKTFWTPLGQENVPEASTILAFINELYAICKMKLLSNSFDAEIPFNSWTYEGSGTGVTRMNRKKAKNKQK